MSATALPHSGLDRDADSDKAPRPTLLSFAERSSLAVRLTLSMVAGGLLCIALIWRVVFPADQSLSELVAGLAALLVTVPVMTAAWDSLRHPSLHGMSDQLVALALLACWATGDLITAAILPIVMIIGHVLEERSLLGSREAIGALGRLVQSNARRLTADGRSEEVPTQALRIGDRIQLHAGDRVPVDGMILDGAASIDTASLTGESVPIEVQAGQPIMAGSVNLDGSLVVEVTSIGDDTTLGKIVALMHEAEAAKPPVTRLLEAYSGHYMVLILLVAAGVWFATGSTAAMLAVLVASCPCALVLAAPATAVAAIAVAARHGILIKGSAFLEQLAEVTSVVFDKTGTVTSGKLNLVGLHAMPGVAEGEMMALAASLGAESNHPVSRALAGIVQPELHLPLHEAREDRGLGMHARLGEDRIAMGRPALLASFGIVAHDMPDHDGPMVALSRGSRFLGWLMLADEPRPESFEALEDLRQLGLRRQILLTGDRAKVAQRIGRQLGIGDICADALPEQKMHRVLDEVQQGFKPMVIGDGINDSLALKAGAVGVAMGAQGTDVALASADLVLMTSDLRRLATCIRLSRRCRRTIHMNVAFGLGWTIILIVLAACGLLGAEGAIIAAVVHNFSTLVGMANSGRLLLFDETVAVPQAPTTSLAGAAAVA
ncbi:cadmium-translocating P-type ATPase [Acidisoma cellulosilytica]|uniref:P-type Zn(2+) transporter n=1 Tax=Acidisoma cellulosilyticum TaxID=2802395 RepID=A0A964E601_9PROT|nr:cation-translocating P-type ATPase [Acidisoma cellulosilyticum]MCB8883215.1 cadmium-translocating P-type ATPase [Acidisoma cellulosilyticum]